MDAVVKYNYWTFDLSPFIFEVKNIPFQWVTTWWGALLILLIFGGGFLFTQIKVQNKGNRDLLQSFLIYVFVILALLFSLQKYHVHWGLRWYSTMYLLGFLSFYFAASNWIKKKSYMLTENLLVNLITYIIIGMLIGARLAYVFIYNFDYYAQHPWESIATWEGGLAFHGGVVGIMLAVFIFCKRNKIPFFHLTDGMALMTPIGIGFGRLGNFMNGELWGRPIVDHIPWAIIFPTGGPIPRHPSQIYQSLGEGWGLFLTLFIISRFKQKEGTVSACFIMFYGLYRFIVEYFRAADVQVSYFYLNHYFEKGPLNAFPNTQWWQLLTMGQILCLSFFLAGLILLFLTRNNILQGTPQWIKRNDEFFARQQTLSSDKKS